MDLPIAAAPVPTPPFLFTFNCKITFWDRADGYAALASSTWPKQRQRKHTVARAVCGWVLWAALAFALWHLAQMPRSPAVHDTPPTRQDSAILLALVATLLVANVISSYYLWKFVRPVRCGFSFGAEGIQEQRRTSTTSVNWQSFDSWSETDRLFVLRKTPSKGSRKQGLFIPKRSFENDEEMDVFRKLIASRMRQS
jgi:hypothetical protein